MKNEAVLGKLKKIGATAMRNGKMMDLSGPPLIKQLVKNEAVSGRLKKIGAGAGKTRAKLGMLAMK